MRERRLGHLYPPHVPPGLPLPAPKPPLRCVPNMFGILMALVVVEDSY